MPAVESHRPPAPAANRLAVLLVVGLLALAALAAYRNTFSVPFLLDDAESVTENPTLHQLWPPWTALSPPRGGGTVAGRPVLNFSLAVNHAISGEEVWSYHALNLLIHFLAALALFGIVRRTLGKPLLRPRFGPASLPLAATIAGLWMLHPLQTEAVTYVCQRSESLAGLFVLLTLYGFIRATESSGTGRPIAWLAASWLACLLGMVTKETAVVAPLLVLLYELTFVREEKTGRLAAAWRQRRGYYAGLAATWILLGVLVAGNHERGGTAGFQSGVAPADYLLTQCRAIVVYLQLCFWPHPQVFDYGKAVVTHLAAVWPQAALLAGLAIGTAIALWRRWAVGFVGAWFFAMLAPSSSFVPVASQTMAEHRMYLPLAAVVTLTVLGLYAVVGRRGLALWSAVALGLGWLTFVRNETYSSPLALWRDTVAKMPHNSRARYNLGIAYSDRGQYAQAVAQDEAALRMDDSWDAAHQAPSTQNKLGYDLEQLGRLTDAVTHYEEALRLRPDYAVAHRNLARALVRLGHYPAAIEHYEQALRLKAGEAPVEAELANALLHEGRLDEAVAHCRAAFRLSATFAPAANNLGYALLLSGQADAAISAYREAVRLDPRYAAAWDGLGYALIDANRPAEAIAPCSEAVRLQPRFADAYNTLGIALAQTGRTAEAIDRFEQALRLGADKPDVHSNLGQALAMTGRTTEAVGQFKAALRLMPDYAPALRGLRDALRRASTDTDTNGRETPGKSPPGQHP